MKRRTLLATAGGSLLAAAAGCIATSNADGESPTETDPGSETPTGSPTPADGGDEGGAAGASFEGIPCPSFAEEVDRTVCSHTGSAGDAPVYPAVSERMFAPTTGDGEVETMDITVHNGSDATFGLNPHDWKLKERTGDGWSHVAPEEYVETWYTLAPGQTFTWEVSVEERPTPNRERTLAIPEDIGSGTYAFQVVGFLDESTTETPTDDSQEKTRIECVALFRVDRD